MTLIKKSIGKKITPIKFVASLESGDCVIHVDALEQLNASRSAEALAWLGHNVLGLMHAPSVISVSLSACTNAPISALCKKPSRKHAAGKNSLQFIAWPGSDFGVRAPSSTEIALSWQEVQHGRVNGLFEVCDDSQAISQG